jgi:hypothetical protein
MKIFFWVLCAFNIYQGLYFFLNVVNLLDSSKYSAKATVVFALLFLAMGAGGIYYALGKNNYRMALLLGLGPWVLGLVFLLFNMLFSDYK